MNKAHVNISKILSLVLRHKPGKIGLTLDSEGWAGIDELIRCANQHGKQLTKETIAHVVANNDKKRFALSEDGKRIRASQGHSINIDLGLEELTPPRFLYHGTATRFLESIQAQGLKSSGRQHVHLSGDRETAVKVGQRHGKPVVLVIDSERMHEDGYKFYRSANNVWLTDTVPTVYFKIGSQ